MLLGLVQLGRLNGGEAITMSHHYSDKDIGNEKDEFDLISDAGVGDLF